MYRKPFYSLSQRSTNGSLIFSTSFGRNEGNSPPPPAKTCRPLPFKPAQFLVKLTPNPIVGGEDSRGRVKRRIRMAAIIASFKEHWNEWELRALVLLSLIFQIILIIMGNRRKYINNIWMTIVVWLPYLIADAVATTALGVLTRNTIGNDGHMDADVELKAFWSPFLLLHLGGPDTITAYSLEDNELWTRHLLQLVVQTGFAFYIFLMAWTGSLLSILSIPMLLVGLLKYGERTWVLWSASYKQRRASLSIIWENVKLHMLQYLNKSLYDDNSSLSVCEDEEDSLVAVAYRLHKVSNWFFLDMPLNQIEFVMDMKDKIWEKMSRIKAFIVIEMELGFMYDMLFTKAMVTYNLWGIILRIISFVMSSVVLMVFSVSYHRKKNSKTDLCITFLLLVVAVCLEVYSALVLLSSNQAIAWFRTNKRWNISRAITSSLRMFRNPTWSNMMGQFNMLSYILQEKPMGFRRLLLSYLPKIFHQIHYILELENNLEREEYDAYEQVPEDLKVFIFKVVFEERDGRLRAGTMPGESICSTRGKISLDRHGYDYSYDILSQIIKMDFEQSIIIWHIATELGCHFDHGYLGETITNHGGGAETGQSIYEDVNLCYKISKYISRYMMHLLVISSDLLPEDVLRGETIFKETCRESRTILKEEAGNNAHERERENKIQRLFDAGTDIRSILRDPTAMMSITDSTLLHHACILLECLSIDSKEENELKRRWGTICGVWMELLAYEANECTGNQHAQLLRQGGELLTHVSLVMAHFGLTKHFPLHFRA